MIEGKGDLASVLTEIDRPDRLFFARGVSNSQETRESEYQREKDILLQQPKDNRLVYFGSLSVFYNDTRYTKHKLEMESLVKTEFPRWCITRIGTITWGDNPNTIINTLKGHVARQEPLEIKDVYRYVIEKDEFLHWVSLVPDFNVEMNIPGTRMKVREIVKKYVL